MIDVYRDLYSKYFHIPYKKVTKEQRLWAKHNLWLVLYSRNDKSIEEQLNGKH